MVLPALDEETGIRVDFIFSFTPYEQQAIERGVLIPLQDVEVNFASPEDLVIHKIFSHRPRDIEDARNVLVKNPSLDRAYIEKWLAVFDQALQRERFLETFQRIYGETNGGEGTGRDRVR